MDDYARAVLERDRLRVFVKSIADRGGQRAADAPRVLAAVQDEAKRVLKACA